MNSEDYLATGVNADRRAIDAYYELGEKYKENPLYQEELKKTAHREFTTAYITGFNDRTINYDDSQSKGTFKFMANVLCGNEDSEYATIEQRNRFKVGDELEILSPTESFNKVIKIEKMENEKVEQIDDAKLVQQKIRLYTNIKLSQGDILRKRV